MITPGASGNPTRRNPLFFLAPKLRGVLWREAQTA
jgi:hypothetical protein